MDEANIQTILYRLDKIDETIAGFKDLLVKVTLQDTKLQELQKRVGSIEDNVNQYVEGQNGKYLKVESDLKTSIENLGASFSEKLASIEARLQNIETAPIKEKAGRWQYILDYIFKAIVAACIGGVLIFKK